MEVIIYLWSISRRNVKQFSNTKKRVENRQNSTVFLTNYMYKVSGNMLKHCLSRVFDMINYLEFSIEMKTKGKKEK